MDEFGSISRHLLQFSPDALLVVNAAGTIVFANPTTRQLFGYTSEQLIGQSLEMLIPERYRLRHGAHVEAFLAIPSNREMGARLADLFARRADGTEFPAGIRLAPFHEGGQMLVGAAIRDMTERRAISDALIAAREDAERANHAKTRFLASASHDLRQPLQTIRLLNASLLSLKAMSPQIHELLERQQEAIDAASRMLDALLDITRLESGAIEPQLAPVSLGAILADLAREFESLAASKNLALEFRPTFSGTLLSTDRILFSQLLQNLVGNAIKYTDTGFVRVTQSMEPDALNLWIEDSGIGIPEDKLDRIFDEYYQVDAKGKQRSGVGLGLAIVRELSRLLGCSVSISSTVGEGTRARVRIPTSLVLATALRDTAAGPLVESATASSSDAGAAAAVPRASRGRVVLLEDNESVRKATELFLSLEGHEVQGAASVSQAEPLLAEFEPGDVFISDYHLDGEITGLEVLEQLRARQRRDVPAILLTGDLQSMLRVVKGEIPCCRFLSKPVDTRALLEAIAALRLESTART